MLLLLILPVLICGFIVCNNNPYYYYKLHRIRDQYLYLQSVKCGIFLLIVSSLFILICNSLQPNIFTFSMNPNIKKEYCRFQHPFLEDGFIMDELELFNVQVFFLEFYHDLNSILFLQ